MQKTSTNEPATEIADWTRIVILCAYASAFFAAIGLVFLVIFFSGVPLFGPLNDTAVIIHYLLLLPIMVYLYRLLKQDDQPIHELTLVIGLFGAVGVILLQGLLVLGVMPFNQQIVFVIPAFLIGTIWFFLIERLGRHDERLPKGRALYVLAGLVFAYPVWALMLARRLERSLKVRPAWAE